VLISGTHAETAMLHALSLDTAPSPDASALQARLRGFLREFHEHVTRPGIGGDQRGVKWVPAHPAMLERAAIRYGLDSRHAMER
jgi:hypothetical protein